MRVPYMTSFQRVTLMWSYTATQTPTWGENGMTDQAGTTAHNEVIGEATSS